MLALHGDDIERQVRTLILQTMGIKEHSLDNIAALLHLHKRTLQRKLKDKGLYFKSILNEVRINTACWHLEASNMDITLISEILGYRDISAFSRAFKSEMKCSALQWRKKKNRWKNTNPYYAHSANPQPHFPCLKWECRCDACVLVSRFQRLHWNRGQWRLYDEVQSFKKLRRDLWKLPMVKINRKDSPVAYTDRGSVIV